MPDLSNVGGFALQQAGYLRTPFGTLIPPGGEVRAFVRGTNGTLLQADQDNPLVQENLYPTLASALNKCRPNRGDTVIVLEGHTENVTDATMLANLQIGTKIIGVGDGTDKPNFLWTATGSQWAINKANVKISGLRLRISGANGVVKGILTTAANVMLADNEIEMASGAALKATIGIEAGAGADGFKLLRNYIYGSNTHNVTDGIKVVAAVNDLLIADNLMHFSATAGNGNIHVTAAALRLAMLRNILTNDHTASTTCIAIDAVACTGVVSDNYMAVISAAATPANSGITTAGTTLSATALLRCFNNLCCTAPATSGIVSPVADA